ncbi:hypothetical protein [Escherichia coli]|uniref:hypothetical protein n=1 Tax=Escherichia coli TaxID=562 RepID=UPI00202744FF|nr:hypothetical protein [Escherichia coli]
MSAFSFNTTYQPTGDQQKDAIAQIGIMQNRAVQANLAYQSCRDSGALFKVLHQVNNELHDLLDSRKRKLTAVCSHQTRIGNLDAHLI